MRLLIAVILFVCVVAYEAKKHENFSFYGRHYGVRMLAAKNLDARCNKQVVTKLCRAGDNTYYYDSEAQQCSEYDEDRCLRVDSNGNSFKTFEDCVTVCHPREPRCQKDPSESPCRNPPRNIFYDKTTKTCRKYPNDKCLSRRAEENSFFTEEDCIEACERDEEEGNPFDRTRCSQARREINCRPNLSWKKFYYDASSKTCVEGLNRVCYDGANAFRTKENCEKCNRQPLGNGDCVQVITDKTECEKVKENYFYKNEECFKTNLTTPGIECGGVGNSHTNLKACENKCVIVS